MTISRFNNTKLVLTKDGKETYGLVEGMDILRNLNGSQYQSWTVENGYAGRPDLISTKFYGLAAYEFAIVFANRPKNPLNWPIVGQIIKIPDSNLVRTLG